MLVPATDAPRYPFGYLPCALQREVVRAALALERLRGHHVQTCRKECFVHRVDLPPSIVERRRTAHSSLTHTDQRKRRQRTRSKMLCCELIASVCSPLHFHAQTFVHGPTHETDHNLVPFIAHQLKTQFAHGCIGRLAIERKGPHPHVQNCPLLLRAVCSGRGAIVFQQRASLTIRGKRKPARWSTGRARVIHRLLGNTP